MSLQAYQNKNLKRKLIKNPKRPKSSKKYLLPKERLDDVTMNLKFSDQAAAVVIQKEVRKFLGGLGFYEAKIKDADGNIE
jgi:hypothetical protein